MATYLAFHAHPDDEAIATGGTMVLAGKAGHRVVLVSATRGERGEVADGVLDSGQTLGARRELELREAAELLGVHRLEFLGYRDSGMIGEPTNNDPECFWQADVEEAAERLAEILIDEQVEVISLYDENGGYGHPDHIQVNRVGHRAAQIAGVARVYESTMNRDHLKSLWDSFGDVMAEEVGGEAGDGPPDIDQDSFGSPAAVITTTIDVESVIAVKRDAMAAHSSQIDESSMFMKMPDDLFRAAFGREWFIRTDSSPSSQESWIFDEALPGAHGGD